MTKNHPTRDGPRPVEAAGSATIGVSVLVLTLALLGLYRVVVWRGRRAEAAAEVG